MTRSRKASLHGTPLAVLLLVLPSCEPAGADCAGETARTDAPRVRELRAQRVEDTIYFHVRFDAPDDMSPAEVGPGPYAEPERGKLARLPQLVPQDGKAR